MELAALNGQLYQPTGPSANLIGDPWEGRTILIVDDEAYVHEFMQILMRSAARLESAYNGLEAVEATGRLMPDLIVMDLRMPVLNGLDATRRLKSDARTRHIPVLAVTAQSVDEEGVRALDSCANGFISKPVDIRAFKSEVGRILGAAAIAPLGIGL